MERILNTRTKTVHKPNDETNGEATACGSLSHVPQTRTQVVSDEEIRASVAIDRCGSCFEDAGGY